MDTYWLTREKDGRVAMEGIDQPPGEVWPPSNIAFTYWEVDKIAAMIADGAPVYLVLKIPAYTFWRGRGDPRGIAGTEFVVLRATRVNGESVKAERVVSIPLRQRR